MNPFHDYYLKDVIADRWDDVCRSIDYMPNEEIVANYLEILAENIYQKSYIEPIEIFEEDFSKRDIKQGKIKKYIDSFYRDYYDPKYVYIDGIVATFWFPFKGEEKIFSCRASTFSTSRYPEIDIYKNELSICIERTLDELSNPTDLLSSLENSLNRIKTGLSFANADIGAYNDSLKTKILALLQEKRKKVEAFFHIAKMLEVPVEKKEYDKTHIPLERKIVPIASHYESSDYYDISNDDYKDILTTIKHTASTYERTPSSYKSLKEEDLRNTLLAALNATYKGDATGEAFRNAGKTDICIERENRAAFVAECKMWTGQNGISEAIKQLDSYLTWRDCKTALIYFVRRKDFIKVLLTAEESLKSFEWMKNVTAVDKNEFKCLFLSNSNPGQQIKMQVMLFNLYCEK